MLQLRLPFRKLRAAFVGTSPECEIGVEEEEEIVRSHADDKNGPGREVPMDLPAAGCVGRSAC
jgi:hypothetical protein